LTNSEKCKKVRILMKKYLFSLFSLLLILTSISALRPIGVNAADCGGPVPTAPGKVWAKSGPRAGEVTLYWEASPYANRYAVAFGTTSGKYIYGADNIGGANTRSYTVKHLSPGAQYYFSLAAARDCSSSPFSKEVSARAMGGEVIAKVTPKTEVAVKPAVQSEPVKKVASVGKQKMWAKSGPKAGQVTLNWQHADSADNYHLVYGTMPGKYQYGALNIGNVTSFKVGYLVPGKTYYFALVPLMNNRPLYTTGYISARAMNKVEIVSTTKEALIQPKSDQQQVSQTTTPVVQPTSAIEPTKAVKVMPTEEIVAKPSPEATGTSELITPTE